MAVTIDFTVSKQTSGCVPCAIWCDAAATTSTETSKPWRDLLYRWVVTAVSGSYAPGDYAYGNTVLRSKAVGFSPFWAHVIETAGTYLVTLQVYDGTGWYSDSESVTVVTAASLGMETKAVSQLGDFTGAPAGSTHITSSGNDFDEIVDLATEGKQILAVRGETWLCANSTSMVANGPVVIGAYGSGNKPKVTPTDAKFCLGLSSAATPTIKDFRIMDWEFDGTALTAATQTARGVSADGTIKEALFLRMVIHHLKFSFVLDSSVLSLADSETLWDKIFLMDSELTVGEGGNDNGGNIVYAEAHRYAALGCLFHDSTQAEHVVRHQFLRKAILGHSTFSNRALGRGLLTIRAYNNDTGQTVTAAGDDSITRYVTVSDNIFDMTVTGTTDSSATGLGPSNPSSDQRIEEFRWERNFHTGTDGAGFPVAMLISATKGKVANNIFKLSDYGTEGPVGIKITLTDGTGVEPEPDDILIYNNSFYSDAAYTGTFRSIFIFPTANNVTNKNNLTFVPNAAAVQTIDDDGVGTVGTEGNNGNSSDAQANGASEVNPFVSADPSAPADFEPTGYALLTAVATTAYNDYKGEFRGSSIVRGALEVGTEDYPDRKSVV